MRASFKYSLLLGLITLAGATTSHGVVLDLEIGLAADGFASESIEIEGALFSVSSFGAGTGTLDPFLRVQADPTEVGMNTDAGSPLNDEKSGNFTRTMQLSVVPVNTLAANEIVPGSSAGSYFEIQMDINESQGAGGIEFALFNELQIWVSETAPADYGLAANGNVSPDDNSPTQFGSLVWDLDANLVDGRSLKIGESNNGGGSGDAIMYFPVDDFLAAAPNVTSDWYFTIWVEMAESSAGFEEFSVIDLSKTNTGVDFVPTGQPIPEPSQYSLLLGCIMLGFVCIRRTR